jgi:UDP-3-O-[3-hydroxymyristoyl] glucosamine N-acyltransferase
VTWTLAELAARVGGEVDGDRTLVVEGVAPLEDAGPAHLSFLASAKYRKAFEASRAGAVLVEPAEPASPGRTVVRVRNASLAFAKISTLFHPAPEAVPGVAPEAVVHPSARVHPSAQVMPLATVAAGAEVGARTILHAGVRIGEGARIGAGCVLHANVVVRERCVVGDRVVVQPGAVIGSDGFGFAFDPEGDGTGPRHFKVPQAGIVVVEDDVEIGANAAIDRATLGVTRIGRGVKIDNLVQVGHNVEVGPLAILCGQVGVAGSSRIGAGAVLAGQVGIAGHLRIGDRVTLGAQAGVMNDIPAGETWMGYPARPHTAWAKTTATLDHLVELRKEVRALRRELDALRGAKAAGEEEP